MFFRNNSKNLISVPVIKEYYALGTINQLKVYGKNSEKASNEAVKKINEIDDKMSAFKEYSEISRINHYAGVEEQHVSDDTYFVTEKALKYSSLSQGAFDPTIRPVVELWGIQTEHARIPEKHEILNKLQLVNYNDIILNQKKKTVKLKNRRQALDLGAIAKGYAADEIKEIFKKRKIQSAVIDLGGNIYAYGSKPDGKAWNIGIQDPLNFRGQYFGIVSVENKSVVTSGNYERYIMKDDKKYHHLIDPRNGYPSDNGIISTTVISENSIDGDALTTCIYILGLRNGIKLIEETEGVEAIFVMEDKKIYLTSGIKNELTLLNKEYEIQNDLKQFDGG